MSAITASPVISLVPCFNANFVSAGIAELNVAVISFALVALMSVISPNVVGASVGVSVGASVDASVGASVGVSEGAVLGVSEGAVLGVSVGFVSSFVTVTATVAL